MGEFVGIYLMAWVKMAVFYYQVTCVNNVNDQHNVVLRTDFR